MLVSINTSNKDAALALASRGLHVFLCGPDKKPKVKAWEQVASATPLEIAVKWDGSPDSLPGLPVGAHGLIVIDADRKPGGSDGVAAFIALCAEQGVDLFSTLVVETPSGGFHFYFRTEIAYGNSSGSLPAGIDVRGKGGYVIGPGATLPDGRGYRVVQGSWDAIAPLPDALENYLRPKDASTSQVVNVLEIIAEATEREKEYAAAALEYEIEKLSKMKPGMGRNDALNASAHALGTMIGAGWLDAQATARALLDAATVNGHVTKHGEAQTCKTIESGINAGMLKPRAPLPIDDVPEEYIKQTQANLIAQYRAKNPPTPEKEWPLPISADAYVGIAGDFVRLVAPHTEGDPNALLIAFLTAVGSLVGRGAYLSVGATSHYANLFAVIVAETSKGRKGTVMNEVQRFAKMIDPTIANRMKSGLSSGEGLIEHIRDPIEADVPIKERGKVTGHQRQLVDTGVSDKRLLVTEDEMGQTLTVAGREGNTLSATLRLAWDGKQLATMARNNKNICKEPYVSILGNITQDELQSLLTATDRNNGFGNRFIWVCARRSQLLPFGGNADEAALQSLALKAAHVVNLAAYYGKCGWQADAASIWAKEYSRLSSGGNGLAGAMSARAEAQTLRLALIYALLDGCNNVDVHHLRAALEVWRYCQESVDYCFGGASGSTLAEAISNLLASSPTGVTLTRISEYFNRNKSRDELQRALDALKHTGKARSETRKTAGRPATLWFAA